MSDDHRADTGQQGTEGEGIQAERRKIYDVEEEPDKDFWTEITSKHQLKRTDYSHLPDSLEEIRESDSNIERVERSKSKKKNILDEYSVPDEAEHI